MGHHLKKKEIMKKSFYLLSMAMFLFASVNSLYAQWLNGQNAQYVIGQANFTSYTAAAGSIGAGGPYDIAVDAAHGKMYVSMMDQNRVLRYSYPLSGNQPVADLVFGQADFSGSSANRGGSIAANSINAPQGLTVENGNLWVCDKSNNRILKYSSAYSIATNGPSADLVIGQPDFNTGTYACTAAGLWLPSDLSFDANGNLWVADYRNYRVLKYLSTNLVNGASANGVLGAPDFTTMNDWPIAANTIGSVNSVYADGTTLWVTDNAAYRVLRFDNALAKANNANADGILGQLIFTTYGSSTTQSTFAATCGLGMDLLGNLYVSDINNHRILIFKNAAGKSNGADADYVIGQTDFTTSASQKGQAGLFSPRHITVDPVYGKLFVADWPDNRVMVYSSSLALPVELTSLTASTSKNGVTLNWKTATETNNYGFEIQRSAVSSQQSNKSWSKLGFVEGNGTTNAPKSYSFTDKSASGKISYRLKQIDRDGKFEYSQVVEVTAVTTPKEFALEQNYPNPFNPTTAFSYQLSANSFTTLKIYDAIGREVATLVNEAKEAGTYSAQFDGAKLSSGIYFAKLTSDRKTQMKKLLLLK
jgi:hypothetical protein